jgi:hypothetical protein
MSPRSGPTAVGTVTSDYSKSKGLRFFDCWRAFLCSSRRITAARTGSMAGVSSRAESRTDGLDFAFIFNTRHLLNKPVDDFANELNALISATTL